jgi:hypothetical protein
MIHSKNLKNVIFIFLTIALVLHATAQNNYTGLAFQGKTSHSVNGINLSLTSRPTDAAVKINGFHFDLIGSGFYGPVLGMDNGNYIEKTLNNYDVNGVSVGLTLFNGKVNGVAVSPIISTFYNFNGLNLSLINMTYSNFNGMSIGGINSSYKSNGIFIGGINWSIHTSGIQIGIFNRTKDGRCLQFGLINYIKDNPKGLKILPFINMRFRKRVEGSSSTLMELASLRYILHTIDSILPITPDNGLKVLYYNGIAYGNVSRSKIDNSFWKKSKNIVPDSPKIKINNLDAAIDADEISNFDNSVVLLRSNWIDPTSYKLTIYRKVKIGNNYFVYASISDPGRHGIDYLIKFSKDGDFIDYATSTYVK